MESSLATTPTAETVEPSPPTKYRRRKGPSSVAVRELVARMESRLEAKVRNGGAMPAKKSLDPEALRADVNAGLSQAQLAQKNGCSVTTVQKHLERAGIEMRGKRRRQHNGRAQATNGHAAKALARSEAQEMSELLATAWTRLPLPERLRMLLGIV